MKHKTVDQLSVFYAILRLFAKTIVLAILCLQVVQSFGYKTIYESIGSTLLFSVVWAVFVFAMPAIFSRRHAQDVVQDICYRGVIDP